MFAPAGRLCGDISRQPSPSPVLAPHHTLTTLHTHACTPTFTHACAVCEGLSSCAVGWGVRMGKHTHTHTHAHAHAHMHTYSPAHALTGQSDTHQATGVRILTLTHTVSTYLMLCASNLCVLPMSVDSGMWRSRRDP